MLKKAPLKDTFSRVHNYLRISLTERCNLRCTYCMPEQGIELTPDSNLMQRHEIVRLAQVFAGLGVRKIRLTGGEPLVYKETLELCREIRTIPTIKELCMTTNGIKLPRMIEDLHAAGVTGLNISLDTLDAAKFMVITRRNGLNKVLDSIRMAEMLGYNPVKINCVVMRGINDDEIVAFAEMTRDRPLEVRFIEYMPFDDNKWTRTKMLPFMEMMDIIEHGTGQKLQALGPGETAKLFKVPGYRGSLGFITSMTTHFCGTCNRLRLTADGKIKVCLFGEDEVSLLALMRGGASDADLEEVIRKAVTAKHFSHGGKGSPEELAASLNRPMIKIGG